MEGSFSPFCYLFIVSMHVCLCLHTFTTGALHVEASHCHVTARRPIHIALSLTYSARPRAYQPSLDLIVQLILFHFYVKPLCDKIVTNIFVRGEFCYSSLLKAFPCWTL